MDDLNSRRENYKQNKDILYNKEDGMSKRMKWNNIRCIGKPGKRWVEQKYPNLLKTKQAVIA